jgi:hypothetical protein
MRNILIEYNECYSTLSGDSGYGVGVAGPSGFIKSLVIRYNYFHDTPSRIQILGGGQVAFLCNIVSNIRNVDPRLFGPLGGFSGHRRWKRSQYGGGITINSMYYDTNGYTTEDHNYCVVANNLFYNTSGSTITLGMQGYSTKNLTTLMPRQYIINNMIINPDKDTLTTDLYGDTISTYGAAFNVENSSWKCDLLQLDSSGYVNCIPSDIGKTVQATSSPTSYATGTLLDYNNTSRYWLVQRTPADVNNKAWRTDASVEVVGGITGKGTASGNAAASMVCAATCEPLTLGRYNVFTSNIVYQQDSTPYFYEQEGTTFSEFQIYQWGDGDSINASPIQRPGGADGTTSGLRNVAKFYGGPTNITLPATGYYTKFTDNHVNEVDPGYNSNTKTINNTVRSTAVWPSWLSKKLMPTDFNGKLWKWSCGLMIGPFETR